MLYTPSWALLSPHLRARSTFVCEAVPSVLQRLGVAPHDWRTITWPRGRQTFCTGSESRSFQLRRALSQPFSCALVEWKYRQNGTNERGCVPAKLYLTKQAVDCSLPPKSCLPSVLLMNIYGIFSLLPSSSILQGIKEYRYHLIDAQATVLGKFPEVGLLAKGLCIYNMADVSKLPSAGLYQFTLPSAR